MMVNREGCDGNYVDIFIDCQEPITKKFLECLSDPKSNKILDAAKEPISARTICQKLPYSNATIYRKIANLSELGLIHMARQEEQFSLDLEKWRYVRTFFVMSVRCGNMGECQCHFEFPIVQIASKKEFLGTILKTIRQYQNN